jgi:hypothetical protein
MRDPMPRAAAAPASMTSTIRSLNIPSPYGTCGTDWRCSAPPRPRGRFRTSPRGRSWPGSSATAGRAIRPRRRGLPVAGHARWQGRARPQRIRKCSRPGRSPVRPGRLAAVRGAGAAARHSRPRMGRARRMRPLRDRDRDARRRSPCRAEVHQCRRQQGWLRPEQSAAAHPMRTPAPPPAAALATAGTPPCRSPVRLASLDAIGSMGFPASPDLPSSPKRRNARADVADAGGPLEWPQHPSALHYQRHPGRPAERPPPPRGLRFPPI